MPTQDSSTEASSSRWFCTCEIFGCGKRKNDSEHSPSQEFGCYLGSEQEFREHTRRDKKRRVEVMCNQSAEVANDLEEVTEAEQGSSSLNASNNREETEREIHTGLVDPSAPERISSNSDGNVDPLPTHSDPEFMRIYTDLNKWRDLFERYKDTSLAYPESVDGFSQYIYARLRRYERTLEKMAANIRNISVQKSTGLLARKDEVVAAIRIELDRVRSTHGDDKAVYVDTSGYKSLANIVSNYDPVTLGCYMLLAILHLRCGISAEDSSFTLQAVSNILQLSYFCDSSFEAHRARYRIPKDIRTVLNALKLHPVATRLVSCPQCFALYAVEDFPPRCNFKKAEKSDFCDATLLKEMKTSNEKQSPIREIFYHNFKEWLGELLWRPGMEALLDRDVLADCQLPGQPRRDIWHGRIMKEFKGPDGESYIKKHGSEGRLVFSLSMDEFNPFQNKQAGKKVSVGGIYLTCESLPPGIRNNPENILLVCIIPGTNHPSLDDINHFLRPLISDFLQFWSTGVYYSETPAYPEGRLMRCVLIPVVCDLPAARQVSGVASHSSNCFCSFCYIDIVDIDDVEIKEKRSGEEHRRCAEEWLLAKSEEDREEIFKNYGVRFSELLHLPYFDMVLFVVLDIMHALFLGNFNRHCNVVLGMSSSSEDGDGEDNISSTAAKTTVSSSSVEKALVTLRQGTLSELEKHTAAVLSKVAKMNHLRYGGSKRQLLKSLRTFRISQGWFDAEEQKVELPEARAEELPDKESSPDTAGNPLSSEELEFANEYVKKAPSSDMLNQLNKTQLVGICIANLEDVNKKAIAGEKKTDLLSRLIAWRYEKGLTDESGNVTVPNPNLFSTVRQRLFKINTKVLGKDTLSQVWKDMNKTILPNWLSAAPSHIGDGKHGKIHADQWRSFCTVHLVITLIRLWGHLPDNDRRKKILLNFMQLVTATKVATMRSITDDMIKIYEENMFSYLRGVVNLFPGVALTPNQHLSLHLPLLLENFGPTHSWRTYPTERFNFILQQTSTNRRFGDLEKTFFDRFCMTQRLYHLLRADSFPKQLKSLVTAFDEHFSHGKRGTLLNDISAFCSAFNSSNLQANGPREDKKLQEPIIILLKRYLEHKLQKQFEEIRHQVVFLRSFSVRGVLYYRFEASLKDCYVIIGDMRNRWYPCRIEEIFTHAHNPNERDTTTATYFVLRKYKELKEEDSTRDIYRRFPIAGGRLYYNEFEKEQELIEAADVLCHFALTPFCSDDINIAIDCVHVLPLDRD